MPLHERRPERISLYHPGSHIVMKHVWRLLISTETVSANRVMSRISQANRWLTQKVFDPSQRFPPANHRCQYSWLQRCQPCCSHRLMTNSTPNQHSWAPVERYPVPKWSHLLTHTIWKIKERYHHCMLHTHADIKLSEQSICYMDATFYCIITTR